MNDRQRTWFSLLTRMATTIEQGTCIPFELDKEEFNLVHDLMLEVFSKGLPRKQQGLE